MVYQFYMLHNMDWKGNIWNVMHNLLPWGKNYFYVRNWTTNRKQNLDLQLNGLWTLHLNMKITISYFEFETLLHSV